jgi:hypothetical protein
MDLSGFSFDDFDFNFPATASPEPAATQPSFFDSLIGNVSKLATQAVTAGGQKLIARIAPNASEGARLDQVNQRASSGAFGQLFSVGVKPDLSSPIIWGALALVAVLVLVIATRKG